MCVPGTKTLTYRSMSCGQIEHVVMRFSKPVDDSRPEFSSAHPLVERNLSIDNHQVEGLSVTLVLEMV